MKILVVAILYVAEVAIEVEEEVEGNFTTKARKMKSISHLVTVNILEADDEANFNNEVISFSFSVPTRTNMVISVMSVELRKWKKGVICSSKRRQRCGIFYVSHLQRRRVRK